MRAVVTGLTGDGLRLQLNGGATIEANADGRYAFATSLLPGDFYTVSVAAAPDNPVQQCIVDDAHGSIASDVEVTVRCRQARPYALLVASETTSTSRPVAGSITTYAAGEPGDLLTPVASNSQSYFVQLSTPVDVSNRRFIYSLVSITTGVDPYPRAVTGIELQPESFAMSDVPAAPYLLSGTGNALTPRSMDLVVAHPNRRFLYVAGHNFPGLSVFSIDQSTGALALTSGNPMLADPNDFLIHFAIHPNGKLAMAAFRGYDEPGDIRSYRIDPDSGALTLIATLAPPAPLPRIIYFFPFILVPEQTFMTADGRFGYFDLDNHRVLTVAMDATSGALSIPANGEMTKPEPASLEARHPFAPFRYYASQTRLFVYRVNQTTGTLSLVDEIATDPVLSAEFDPTGKYLYVRSSNKVLGYAVDSTSGSLTPVPESGADATFAETIGIFRVDPSGQQLYVEARARLNSQGVYETPVHIFNIDRQTGQLTHSPYSPLIVEPRTRDFRPLAMPDQR